MAQALFNDIATEIDEMSTVVDDDNRTKVADENHVDSGYMIGRIVEGINHRYEVMEELKVGGEAVIYICREEHVRAASFVLKLYDRTSLCFNKEKRKKFIDFLYQQKCPYIVPLCDYGQVETDIYGVLEFDIYPLYKNGTLSERSVSYEFLVNTVIPEMNEALNVIHLAGITHRDIKPSNIFLSDDGRHVLISDFSIMSIVDYEAGTMTSTLSRTTGYAGPEIYTGMPHIKSDYYALGISILSVINDNKNLFLGQSEELIMRNTIYGHIPGLELNDPTVTRVIEAGRNKNVEFHTLPAYDRMIGLILGVTRLAIDERWGYEEVNSWINGKLLCPFVQDVAEAVAKYHLARPFRWADDVCENIYQMAVCLAKNWDVSRDEALRGRFTSFLDSERPDISFALDKVVEEMKMPEKLSKEQKIYYRDAIYFRYIYTLCPDLNKLYWKGMAYNRLSELAVVLDNQYRESHGTVIDNSWIANIVMGNISYLMPDDAVVQKIESVAKLNQKAAYFMFIYSFLPEHAERVYDELPARIRSVGELCDYFVVSRDTEGVSNMLLSSDKFEAFMWSLGYHDVIRQAKENAFGEGVSNTDRSVRVMLMLERIASDNERIREKYLRSGQIGAFMWLKDNLKLYSCYSLRAKELKQRIRNINISKKVSISKIRESEFECLSLYQEFVSITYSNIYNLANDICESDVLSDIIPKCSDACFSYAIDGLQVSAGYVHGMSNKSRYVSYMDMFRHESEALMSTMLDEVSGTLEEIKRRVLDVQEKYYKNSTKIAIICLLVPIIIIGGMVLGRSKTVYIAGGLAILFPIISLIYNLMNIKDKAELSRFESRLKLIIPERHVVANRDIRKKFMQGVNIKFPSEDLEDEEIMDCLKDENYSRVTFGAISQFVSNAFVEGEDRFYIGSLSVDPEKKMIKVRSAAYYISAFAMIVYSIALASACGMVGGSILSKVIFYIISGIVLFSAFAWGDQNFGSDYRVESWLKSIATIPVTLAVMLVIYYIKTKVAG